jgi:hypothetical protein
MKKNQEEGPTNVAVLGLLNLSEAIVSVNINNAAMQDVANLDMELSIPVLVLVFSKSNAYILSKDDPTFWDPSDCLCSDSNADTSGNKDSKVDGHDSFDELHLPDQK